MVVALNPTKPILWLWDHSRLLGLPIIATIGLMAVTHQVGITKRQAGILFAPSLIAALLFGIFAANARSSKS
jgi:hypothetical protein